MATKCEPAWPTPLSPALAHGAPRVVVRLPAARLPAHPLAPALSRAREPQPPSAAKLPPPGVAEEAVELPGRGVRHHLDLCDRLLDQELRHQRRPAPPPVLCGGADALPAPALLQHGCRAHGQLLQVRRAHAFAERGGAGRGMLLTGGGGVNGYGVAAVVTSCRIVWAGRWCRLQEGACARGCTCHMAWPCAVQDGDRCAAQ